MPDRRDPTAGSEELIAEVLAKRPKDKPPPKRDRSWDRKHQENKATYLIGTELKERIRLYAEENQVGVSDLVAELLSSGLEELQAGRWSLGTRPKSARMEPIIRK